MSTSPFGGPFQIIDDISQPQTATPSPQEYAAWVLDRLSNLQLGEPGILRFRRPRPTAAFSPQDTTHARYAHAKALASASGFEPIERGTGGRLTMFDENALAITLISPHADPHQQTIKRFELFSGAISEALKKFGIDARIGELPNEYCPGRFSINAEGRVKLVGVAQRMKRNCIQMGAIIAVAPSAKACAAIAAAYHAMDMPFDAATYGAVTDFVPGLSHDALQSALRDTITAVIS
jgi:octanoyl-[GcvH]:protein N-octanoyltransferase